MSGGGMLGGVQSNSFCLYRLRATVTPEGRAVRLPPLTVKKMTVKTAGAPALVLASPRVRALRASQLFESESASEKQARQELENLTLTTAGSRPFVGVPVCTEGARSRRLVRPASAHCSRSRSAHVLRVIPVTPAVSPAGSPVNGVLGVTDDLDLG